jgi:hypothetical protein
MPQASPQEAGRRQAELPSNPSKVAWRILEWAAAVGIGATKTNALIRDKRVESVMLDGRRLITTPPAVFIASLSSEAKPSAAPRAGRPRKHVAPSERSLPPPNGSAG